jgi:hypothetical protein
VYAWSTTFSYRSRHASLRRFLSQKMQAVTVWRHAFGVRDTGHHPVLVAEDLLALERVPDRALVQAPFLLVGVRRYTLFLRFSSRFA